MSCVYLIGTGPGDPDLLTIKAKNILTKCDVVLHDLLVSLKILNYAPKNSERICVGKQKGNHLKMQSQINKLLLDRSKALSQNNSYTCITSSCHLYLKNPSMYPDTFQNFLKKSDINLCANCKSYFATEPKKFKTIVRLKAGTPFLFGKGFEEVEFLQKNNINFEVIPGVSAATSVPESFLIPLTYTKEFSSVAFVSGHFKDSAKIQIPNADTLVYFMGLSNLARIIDKLIKNGRNKKTPCAVLSRGTFPDAQKIIGRLDNILDKISDQKIDSPAMFFVGDILKLYKVLI